MTNRLSRSCVRGFMRAFATAFILMFSTFLLLALNASPASAVRVWNLGDTYEQPLGTPKGAAYLIVSGLLPDMATLPGHRYINLKVVGSSSGKPIENAMAYLVRLPHEKETVVFNTDRNGQTIIWNIEDCYRKLVVTDGVVTVKQWVSLPQGIKKDLVVKLPYDCLVSVKRPVAKCDHARFYALRKSEQSYGRAYKGWVCCTLLRAWLPPGTYRFMMDACDKNDDAIKRFVWDDVKVPNSKSLYVGARPHVEKLEPLPKSGKPRRPR